MEKKNINWGELGFSYQQTEKRFVANFKDGAWDEGTLTEDATITLNECGGTDSHCSFRYSYRHSLLYILQRSFRYTFSRIYNAPLPRII